MILVRPCGILKMRPHRIGSDLPKPLGVIKQTEGFPHLGMTEIVPIAQMGRVKTLHQCQQFPLGREGLEIAPILDNQCQVPCGSLLDKRFQGAHQPFQISLGSPLSLHHRI